METTGMTFNTQTVSFELQGREISIETGKMAKQAGGSVIVRSGNNVVMVTAVASTRPSNFDFFPLTVEVQEKFYASGKIPGGFFKREGRPSADVTLAARLIDRPIRPLFPAGFKFETQVVATILSNDGTFPLEALQGIGVSAALHISDIPFAGPTAVVIVGHIDGEFVLNPSITQLENSKMAITVAGTRNGIMMVEGEAKFISEDEALSALKFAHESMTPVFNAIDELKEKAGKEKREFVATEIDADFKAKVTGFVMPKVKEALSIQIKQDRYAALADTKTLAVETLLAGVTDKDELEAQKKDLGTIFDDAKFNAARSLVLDDGKRIDGRAMDKVRGIACEVAVLPRTHGSGLFTRGETQVLGTVTLGTGDDEQFIETLNGTFKKKFMLHYNFPPYCVGETGRLGGQSRREIGHGMLAERAVKAVLPDYEKFPYTIRVVSEVLESNGSSSMGTVCSGILALLDAGVPIKGNVAGIAMGLIKEGDKVAVLSDILGDEDHLGDMDFKVAGTREGITALQMDIKIDSITFEIMEKALSQAKGGRCHILDEMEKVMSTTRGDISEYAPRIESIKVKPDKVRSVIGAGGKVIKGIVEQTGVKIDIEDDGTINIASSDPEATKKAMKMIEDIVAEPEVNKTYLGRVVKTTDFGAFVEILPGSQGLLHISELDHERVKDVTDVVNEGDEINVKVLDVDRAGRIKLSRKALLEKNA